MPIDHSIYSQIKQPEIESPFNALAKMVQIQSLQREGEMFNMKKAQYEQELATKSTRNDLLNKLFAIPGATDDRPYNALTQGASAGSIGPTTDNAARLDSMPASKPGQPRMDLNVLSRLAASGVKTDDLLAIFKYQNDGVKRDTNAYYQDPSTGETKYYADPTKGMDFNPSTRTVSPLTGYAQTNAGIKSAETNAIEGAKSNYELLPLGYVGKNGQPIGGSKGEYLGVPSPNSPQFGSGLPDAGAPQLGQPQQGQPAFIGHDLLMQIPEQERQKILQNATRDGTSQFTINYKLPNGRVIKGEVDLTKDHTGGVPAVIQQKADYMRSKATPQERQQFEQQALQGMANIPDPQKRAAAITDFFKQMSEPAGTPIRMLNSAGAAPAGDVPTAPGTAAPSTVTSAGQRPVLQSEAERESQVGSVKVQNAVEEKRLKDSQERMTKDTRLYQQLTSAIPMARALLKEATGSGAGALADQAMAFFGKSTKGAQAAQALDTIGGWMTSNVPRMEGPQSNIDILNYQTMAARVADRAQPNEARLAALDVLEKLQQKYAEINGVASGGPGPTQPTQPGQPGQPGQGGGGNIPEGAIKMLRSNPALRSQFEGKYGVGSATSILGK